MNKKSGGALPDFSSRFRIARGFLVFRSEEEAQTKEEFIEWLRSDEMQQLCDNTVNTVMRMKKHFKDDFDAQAMLLPE